MQDENNQRRGQLKGYMFEVVIRHLLYMNNFEILTEEVLNRVKRDESNNFIEIKGRGTWHQIDSPCVYKKSIPFTYDLRLLAEVKFHKDEIQKEKVREFLGVIKDISENYFIEGDYSMDNQTRYLDVGVFFAANGFQTEAEKLAFAHGIKTISYKNNSLMKNIKDSIIDLEKNYIYARNCISAGNRIKFMQDFSRLFDDPFNNEILAAFIANYKITRDGVEKIQKLTRMTNNIKTSFFGVTPTNCYLHFISNSIFPSYLFENTDEQTCKVYYQSTDSFYLILDEDNERTQFHFSAPTSLLNVILYDPENVLDGKRSHFSKIKVSISLNGIQRSLLFKINETWLNNLVREQNYSSADFW